MIPHNTVTVPAGNLLFSVLLYILCLAVFAGNVFAEECAIDPKADKKDLERALEQCQKQIQQTEVVLRKQQADRTNTEYEILLIDNEINKALVRIQSSESVISRLSGEINENETQIGALAEKMTVRRELLSGVLRRINEFEQRGFLSFLVSDATLSTFFERLHKYGNLRDTLETSVRDMEILTDRIIKSTNVLSEKKTEQDLIKRQRQADANQVKSRRKQKERVLETQLAREDETKDQISIYEARSAEIQNRLFDLSGTGAIPFGQALEYAKQVERVFGVRPAFLLGLIKHESDLGKNVGTGSYLTDAHPTRDKPIFPYIAKALGFSDPAKLPVSARPGFGHGGAMGPAQFIPSTWVCFGGFVNTKTNTCSYQSGSREEFYKGPWRYDASKDKIRKAAKNFRPSNPWNPRDAFFASGMYLKNLGAVGSEVNECTAARKYYAGTNLNSAVAWNYCRAVKSNARVIQRDIDYLEKE